MLFYRSYPLIRAVVFCLVFTSAALVCAKVKLPPVIGSGMVLQRDLPVPVWGWADPGEKVKVVFAGQIKSCEAGSDGRWSVNLDPLKASKKPMAMTITSSDEGQKVILENILVGEVWLCSGQSNMEWGVANSMNAKQEVAASSHPSPGSFGTTGPSASYKFCTRAQFCF